jgi:hypothetical protein
MATFSLYLTQSMTCLSALSSISAPSAAGMVEQECIAYSLWVSFGNVADALSVAALRRGT